MGAAETKPQRIRSVPRLSARKREGHKGDFGRVLVVGGSLGMVGAPSLVAMSALRSGAGLVTLAVPQPIQQAASTLCPCATSIPLPATRGGQIDPAAALSHLREKGLLDAAAGRAPDVLVTGPGVGAAVQEEYAEAYWQLVAAFSQELGIPVVVDADGLNLMRRGGDGAARWDTGRHRKIVITPHPGELARMQGTGTREIQKDRETWALRTIRELAGEAGPEADAVVVLKGAGTLVTDGSRIYVNKTGNPGMATGGTGDVLAGVIAGLIGQGLSCLDAAVLGVHVHGLAGDLAARRFGMISLIATDLIDLLPDAFGTLHGGRARPARR